MKDLVFRKVRKGEESEILDLVQNTLLIYGLKSNPRGVDLDITDINKYYYRNGGAFEIMVYKNKIIGSYGVYKISEEICELRKMYLDFKYQGMGFGNIMIENSFKLAKNLGFKKMTLQTSSVLYKAINLYKKYGFEEIDKELSERCDLAMARNIIN